MVGKFISCSILDMIVEEGAFRRVFPSGRTKFFCWVGECSTLQKDSPSFFWGGRWNAKQLYMKGEETEYGLVPNPVVIGERMVKGPWAL